MRLFNTILTRVFTDCNYQVLKLWYSNIKCKLEENFYVNNILMSGVVKRRDNDVVEILYLKYYAEEELDPSSVLKIYNIGKKTFPDYKQFTYYCQNNSEKDIVNRIIRNIVQDSEVEIKNSEAYDLENRKIKIQLQKPFTNSVMYKQTRKSKLVELQESIEKNELAFVGIYDSVLYQNFKEMLCYKLLEKIFGSNDTNGIYFIFRERGWIYTGLSGFVIENDFFYSGAIMQYDLEHETAIKKAIKEFEFSNEDFMEAKNMVLDDFRYSKFQYGDAFALLPYKSRVAEADNYESCIKSITENEVRVKQKQICTEALKLRMKVI